jgi:hypothetical protein
MRPITITITLDLDIPDDTPFDAELVLNHIIAVPGYAGRITGIITPCEPPRSRPPQNPPRPVPTDYRYAPVIIAGELGHDMTAPQPMPESTWHEASCRRCERELYFDDTRNVQAGPALQEPCDEEA